MLDRYRRRSVTNFLSCVVKPALFSDKCPRHLGSGMSVIKMKRVYEELEPRVLTERLWPRGVSKERAQLDRWLKGIAPSHKLRNWFDHDPEKWNKFRERYRRELFGSEAVEEMIQIIDRHEKVTLIYASKDKQHNSTAVLKDFLERLLDSTGK